MTDTITLTIDDRQVAAPAGTLVVDAAKQAGIDVPVFCYHPKLSTTGTCRMCLVEVGTPRIDPETGQVQRDENDDPAIRWSPDLQTACTLPVSEGMVVRTLTTRIAQARQAVIESLLSDHPLDCPICDKGGECSLQDLTIAYGSGNSRLALDDQGRLDKHVPLGDLIILDQERCIQCGRCVRFMEEIADDPALRLERRGRRLELVPRPDAPFDSYFGGNTTDICPVGALTSADFRFVARPWEMKHHASLCNHCAVGCNITLDIRVEACVPTPRSTGDTGETSSYGGGLVIKRVMPRQNEAVNEIWICDKGRYGHHHTRAADRLTTPLIRQDGELTATTWDEALDLVARRIKVVHPAQVAGVAGDRLSNEDLFLFQTLMRDVIGTPHVDTFPSAPGANLVARYGIGSQSNWNHLGQNSVILVVAGDVEEQAPLWFLRIKAAAQRGAKLIVVNGRETRLDRYASHHLRVRYGSAPHLLLGLTTLLLKEEYLLTSAVRGVEEFQENLARFDPAAIERLTDVSAQDLKAAAETFGRAENAIVVFGREGLNDYGALALAQAGANLLLATGHVGRANNGLLPLWPHNNTQGAADMGVRPNLGPGYKEIVEHGWDLSGMLSAARGGSIKLMWVVGADLAGDDPTTIQTFAKAVNPALDALDFLVVQELFLTDTARQADIVLPALSFAERDGTYTSGDRRVQRFERALPPMGQGRADWAILADVARRLGADWDFDSSAGVLAAVQQAVPQYAGISLETLDAAGLQWPPVGAESIYFSGTARSNDIGLGLRWPAAAEVVQRPFGAAQRPFGTAERPFGTGDVTPAFDWVELPALFGADLMAVSVRWLYRQGRLINCSAMLHGRLRGNIDEPPPMEINPHDAERLQLEKGTPVYASSGGRTVQLTVHLNDHVPAGVVLVPAHLPTGPLTVRAVERLET